MRHLNLTLLALLLSFASFAFPPITGTTSICSGSATTLADGTIGGTWYSSNVSIATIDSVAGTVMGFAAGVDTISYTDGTDTAFVVFTVNPNPAPITGPALLCIGSTYTEIDDSTGGSWTSSDASLAPIDPSLGTINTGSVTGPTTALITYIFSATGCSVSTTVTVSAAVAGPITGLSTVCSGSNITLTDAGGGAWSSDNTFTATVDPALGTVTSGAPGTANITYTLPTGCSATTSITVNATPAPISGPAALCSGATYTETDDSTGGSWLSSDASLAPIDASLGTIVAGTITGPTTALITYVFSATGCFVNTTVTVSAIAAGSITGPAVVCSGSNITLTDAGGGAWSSDNTYTAAVDPASGIVTGGGPGTANITYTLLTGCAATTSVTVNGLPYNGYFVTGGGTSCSGTAGVPIGLSGPTPSVVYQLYNGATPAGSPVTGSGAGFSFGSFVPGGSYTVTGSNPSTGCSIAMGGGASVTAALSPVPYAVTGTGAICAGSPGLHIGLASSDTGISYQLYDGGTSIGAALTSGGGVLDFGATTTSGTYTIVGTDPGSGCISNMSGSAVITVNPLPPVYSVSGSGSYCSGTSGLDVSLGFSTSGVSYQLFDGAVAVGSPVPGTGLPLDFGNHTAGTYTVVATNSTTGCTRAMTGSAVIVATLLTPSVSIGFSPGGTICTGATINFAASPVNGGTTPTYTWSVNGSAAGTGSTHTYVPANGDVVSVVLTSSLPCASPLTASNSTTMTVITPHITVSSSFACGGNDTLIAGGGVSYTWSPSTGISCATCDTIIINPTATIVYTLTGTDIYGCVGTTSYTANANRITGHISFATGSIRVWLIQFSPADSSLTAIDSTMACTYSGSPFYEFDNEPAGSYIVKAAVLGGTPGASGYVPTYGISTPYWNNAGGIAHTSNYDTMHITMLYGIVPTGPGFIGGLIVSGAGKNTFDEIPEGGLMVYLEDAVTGNVLTYTYTNSDGTYSFPSLAYGSYIVYPARYGFYTTPAYVVTLSYTNTLVTGIDFKQHNNYGTITPYIIPAAVNTISAGSGLNVFPNPTGGNINIQWSNQATGNAEVALTDIVGREVYHATMNINAASGQTQIGLDGLKDGIYLITIKSGSINYCGKLMIQR